MSSGQCMKNIPVTPLILKSQEFGLDLEGWQSI